MSSKIAWASISAGAFLLAGNLMFVLPFWSEALAFTFFLVGLKLLRPTLERRFSKHGTWFYWFLLLLITGVVYLRWF